MIAGIFHQGSGLGDQLHRYITVRTLAEEKGYEWAMFGQYFFKGSSFMSVDMGKTDKLPTWRANDVEYHEKAVYENGVDIRSYDPEINFVEDNTIIDGSFEDYKYWGHNLENINKWLAVEPLEVPDTTCVIGFRGGEYAAVPELFLPYEYYEEAVWRVEPKEYQVHTDDPKLAKQMFDHGAFEIVDNQELGHSLHSNMGYNWRSARYAKYAIIPNSAFFILPRLLKHHEDPTAVTIAPRFWAGRNVKQWRRPACYYPRFTYI